MGVADGDGEPAVVGPDDVQVEAHRAGDVQLGVFARVVRLVLLLHGLVMAVGSYKIFFINIKIFSLGSPT